MNFKTIPKKKKSKEQEHGLMEYSPTYGTGKFLPKNSLGQKNNPKPMVFAVGLVSSPNGLHSAEINLRLLGNGYLNAFMKHAGYV